jgi:hypothetical protein|nr:MAG TPA: tail protein [Caudoviricetes sp.]
MVINFQRLRSVIEETGGRPFITLLNPDESVVSSVGHYFGLSAAFKFNELSELTFSVPEFADGSPVPYYDQLVGGMLVRIDGAGTFILNNPSQDNSSLQRVKTCTCYSREFELSKKRVVFGAGTYPFWNPVTRSNTFLGMCFADVRGWTIGSVDASLYDRYRTFQDYDGDLLSVCLNTAQQSFGCVFEFDTERRIVNVREADAKAAVVPVYLSFQNLVESNSITENDDEMRTNVSVYGAEGVDIRNVNPTGSNTIVHLGYAISQNQIPKDVAHKYLAWKDEIAANQTSYTALVALRNAAKARHTVESAKLTDLKGELTSLDNLRDINIQGKAMAKKDQPASEEGTVAYFEARLKEISKQYKAKEAEIEAQEELLKDLQAEYDGYVEQIKSVNDRLKMAAYFSPAELDVLDPFLKDGTFTDSTFATFDVDISSSKDSYTKLSALSTSFSDTSVVDVNDGGGHRILMVSGGKTSISGGDTDGSSQVVSAILEIKDGGDVLLSAYLGNGKISGTEHPSGNLTISGAGAVDADDLLDSLTKHTETTTDPETGASHDSVWYTGNFSLDLSDAAMYFTRNVTDFQKYDVSQELFDYATERMEEIAYPVFEFEIKSGNLLADPAFSAFSERLELGSSVYLQLSEQIRLLPILLEVHVNFEDPGDFQLVFSNKFRTKRPDSVNRLKDLLEEAKQTSYTLDVKKFEYSADRLSGATEAFDNFMKNGLNSAYQQVTAGADQEVILDGGGIKVKAKGSDQFFTINNQMIALVDQKAETARMALGHFFSKEYNTDFFGIVADVIFGTLVAGKGLSIACQDINDGSMLFEANSKGVQLHNGRFYVDHDRGGQIAIDPTYGFAIGTKELYKFDEDGRAVLNTDNANLYIDLDGNLHIKGTLDAVDGKFSGIVQATDFLDKAGNSMMTNGKFDSNYLDLGNIKLDGVTGDITMTGNLNLSGLSSINWGSVSPVKYQFASKQSGPWHSDMRSTDYWRRDSLDGGLTWGDAYQFRGKDGEDGLPADLPDYIHNTYISSTEIRSPTIIAGEFCGNEFNVYPQSGHQGSFNIYGDTSASSRYHMLEIAYSFDIGANLSFASPAGARATWDFDRTDFYGTLDFSSADVQGLYLTFS